MKKKHQVLLLLFLIAAIIAVSLLEIRSKSRESMITDRELITQSGVCPPFYLYDEDGSIIDPLKGINEDKPYSPRQTCGKCHDYGKITEGFHFQQGKDEVATGTYADRYQWVSTPGNYGGNWCSPAPLYRYLSPKENTSSRTIDMTSFSFITAGCGECHPGGGSTEYDRSGNRYDKFMLEKGYEPGGVNDLDGDYYQARWSETGVLEADCMICHQPGYNNDLRKEQLKLLNFRWAPTAASEWGEVTGSVDKNMQVKVNYDLSLFDAEGKLSPRIIREPRNEACLFCHAQPGWKKRGANFDARTDVHIRAGMKCVDCHPAGSKALDDRINEREMHQFAKGDDPGGRVRDDLDNTVLDCNYCHTNGHLGAPVTTHNWLPPLHLEQIACQTCHIPERLVKPAQFQASDVFNPGTKIPSRGKHLWVFYGPDMKYYNHYGNMAMMGFDDKPTDPFKPVLARYKGKIRPVNRVHSAWPGIEVEGKPGLMQPKMGDIVKMWEDHFNDPSNYPELSMITDDNDDQVIEVNRPEEIDALISAFTSMLRNTNYPIEGKRVVWATNERVYTSGNEYYSIEKEQWEASPYANVHTYNHDVFPARAGLGINGCTDCHSLSSEFFYASIVRYPFGEDGKPVFEPQHKSLGISPFMIWLSAFREQIIKSFQYPAIVFLFLTLLISMAGYFNKKENYMKIIPVHLLVGYILLMAAFVIAYLKPDVNSFVLPERLWFDRNHFFLTVLALAAGVFTWLKMRQEERTQSILYRLQSILISLALFSGFLMMIKFEIIYPVVRFAYTLFDLAVVLSVFITIFYLIDRQFKALKPTDQ
ncbi:MAG TPA: cytochrome c3 family protein [Bacteroidales bacterium]|nr:cytochrome c3 family protein [Bacteroidales bacterium]